MTKDLREKAVDIKGKKYVLVADRVLYFNETYPNGCIQTEIIRSEDRVEIKATVIPNADQPSRFFTGHSQAVWGDGYINKTSALENAETSAVGRALALMGIGVIEPIASVDEIKKAEKAQVCATCGAEMKTSKAGNLYCPRGYTDPAHKKAPLPPAEQTFMDDLDNIPVI